MADKIYYFNITYHCNNSCLFCAADLEANKTEHEMPIDDLIAFLDEHQVDAADRVIVNGGEPTMHEHFFDFLKAIHRRGALIDLYTNGKKIGNPEFAEELLKYTPLYIRIPLFGATAEMHDRLTGFSGNFDKTVAAIRNILTMRKDRDVQLEVKMLLSKVTVDENEGIFDLISDLFPDDDFYFSLNPLLVSDCVRNRRDMFIESYSSLMKKSVGLISKANSMHRKLQLNLVPYCAFPQELYSLLPKNPHIDKEEYYSDPENSYRLNKEIKDPDCGNCIYISECNHFPASYLSYMGLKEIVPFTAEGI